MSHTPGPWYAYVECPHIEVRPVDGDLRADPICWIDFGGTVETGNDTEGIIESDRARFDRILANARAMFDGRPRDCVTA